MQIVVSRLDVAECGRMRPRDAALSRPERVLFMILMSLFFMIDALGAVVQDALLDAVKFEYLWPTLTYEAEIFTISLLQIWDKLVS